MFSLTGNEIFDFGFGMVSTFAFAGWGIGVTKGLIKRLFR